MSDHTATFDPVSPGSSSETTRTLTPPVDSPAAGAVTPTLSTPDSKERRGPLDDVRVERPRSHPLTYAALAIATLALLLAFSAFTRDDGDGYRQVKIGANDCVIGRQAAADVLYCRTPDVPKP